MELMIVRLLAWVSGRRRAYWRNEARWWLSPVIEHDVLEPLPEVIRVRDEDIIR